MRVRKLGSRGRVLVLGCAGFVGLHLVERLLARPGVEVVGWSLGRGRPAELPSHARLTLRQLPVGSPDARDLLEADILFADWIVDLAASSAPEEGGAWRTIHARFVDALPVVELAAAYRRPLLHVSSAEVYGRTVASYLPEEGYRRPELFVFDADRTPMLLGPIASERWTGACAQQLLERLIYAAHQERGLPFAIVRPFNLAGPRLDCLPGIEGGGPACVLARFLAALLRGEPLLLVDGGTARRSVTSIHDAIDALEAILDDPEGALGHFYNLGNPDNEVSIGELATRMRETFALLTSEERYRSHPVRSVTAAEFHGEGYEPCDRRTLDITKESARLGWRPHRSLDAILRETIAYYLARHPARIGEAVA